jgi:hypothetical protein
MFVRISEKLHPMQLRGACVDLQVWFGFLGKKRCLPGISEELQPMQLRGMMRCCLN